jgi:DNA-directed RNA polymerase subunit RPC12/RpoP
MAKFYCKHCGTAFPSVQSLVSLPCPKTPGKKHALYEGAEKAKYTCKHCGLMAPTIQSLVYMRCGASPTQYHEPAL